MSQLTQDAKGKYFLFWHLRITPIERTTSSVYHEVAVSLTLLSSFYNMVMDVLAEITEVQ